MIKKRVIFFSSDSEKEQCSEVKKDEEFSKEDKKELRAIREELKATKEELKAAKEELKVTKEEPKNEKKYSINDHNEIVDFESIYPRYLEPIYEFKPKFQEELKYYVERSSYKGYNFLVCDADIWDISRVCMAAKYVAMRAEKNTYVVDNESISYGDIGIYDIILASLEQIFTYYEVWSTKKSKKTKEISEIKKKIERLKSTNNIHTYCGNSNPFYTYKYLVEHLNEIENIKKCGALDVHESERYDSYQELNLNYETLKEIMNYPFETLEEDITFIIIISLEDIGITRSIYRLLRYINFNKNYIFIFITQRSIEDMLKNIEDNCVYYTKRESKIFKKSNDWFRKYFEWSNIFVIKH